MKDTHRIPKATGYRHIAAILLPLIALSSNGVHAADPAITPAAAPAVVGPITVKPLPQSELDAARQTLSGDTTLSEAQNQQAQDLYRQANEDLAQAQQASTTLARLQQRIAGAPQQIAQLQRQLQQPAESPPSIPADASLDQLQLQLSQQKAAVSDAEDQLNQVQTRLNTLQTGAKGISDHIADDSRHISQIESDLQAPAGDTPPALR